MQMQRLALRWHCSDMRVINSTARTTVLRELALLRALCASLRDNSRRSAKLVGKALPARTIPSKPASPVRFPAGPTDLPA